VFVMGYPCGRFGYPIPVRQVPVIFGSPSQKFAFSPDFTEFYKLHKALASNQAFEISMQTGGDVY
jgi:hypothetical protein